MPPAASDSAGVRAALVVVSVILVLEALALIAVVIWLVVDLLALQPSSYATAIALIVIVLIAACLLYTSPSPRDGLLSRMPSSA